MNKQTFEYWYENKFSLEQRIKEPHLKELLLEAWDNAYFVGREDGYDDGFSEGRDEGYDEGYEKGHSDGYSDGYEEGYDKGRVDERNIGTRS